MKVLIRPQAWLDIEEDMDYLKDKANDETAVRFYDALRSALRELSKQPGLGRMRPELTPSGIRSWRVDPPFTDWLIFYQLAEEGLDIIRVKHGAMDIQTLFEDQS
jgi:toxin ParE1/3/4